MSDIGIYMMITTWKFIQKKIQWNIIKYCGSKCFVCYFLSTWIWCIYWILFKYMWYMNYDRHELITLWGIKSTFLWLISSYRIHSTLTPLYRLWASVGFPGILPTLLLLLGRIFPQRLPYMCGIFMREMCFAHLMAFNSYVSHAFNIVGTLNIHHTVWVDI